MNSVSDDIITFCDICNNLLEITKITKNNENEKIFEFDNPKDFINHFEKKQNLNDNYKINFDRLTLMEENIENLNKYLEIYNKLIKKNVGYEKLYCVDCKKNYPLIPNQIIFKTNYGLKNYDIENDVEYIINDPKIPITNNYICLNNQCGTNIEKKCFKSAKIYKINNTHVTYYICMICKNHWFVGNN